MMDETDLLVLVAAELMAKSAAPIPETCERGDANQYERERIGKLSRRCVTAAKILIAQAGPRHVAKRDEAEGETGAWFSVRECRLLLMALGCYWREVGSGVERDDEVHGELDRIEELMNRLSRGIDSQEGRGK